MSEHPSSEPEEHSPLRNGLPLVDPDAIEDQHPEQMGSTFPPGRNHAPPVVALGGSAGSIPALRSFLQNTPSESGLSYVVVLHLAPEHESSMPELLQRHTAMPVHAARDGEKMEANAVYVIPPGKHLTATDGHLRLTDLQAAHGKRVAVDLFFRSLADTHGPLATAVVLSGADGDGAIGLKRIKERGGLTIAQSPEEAEHSGMPRSAIATGMVDWILPVVEMPARVIEYHANAARLRLPAEEGPQPAEPRGPSTDQTETQLRDVLAFLRAGTGRDFSYYKRATIVRRIARRMQVNSVNDLSSYLDHLRTHPGETGALLQDLLISVTNFFRDRQCFDALETHVVELFHRKSSGDSVRVWVPACATGEEAYSVAMLLQEQARRLEAPPKLQVFGCDLDEEAIRKARTGFYPGTIAADVSDERLRRFFIKEPGGYRVRHELREMVLFAAHDLLKDAPFSRMDLVSCRNMLIYLNRDAQARALDIFHFALRPNGLLFLGSSESVDEGGPMFAPVDKKHRLFRHLPIQRTVLAVPTGAEAIERLLQKHEQLRYEAVSLAGRSFLPAPAPSGTGNGPTPAAPASELHLKLLSRFGNASLVVDTAYEIIHLSENANRFLQFPEGEPTKNLLQLVHPMLRVDLRAALLRAMENDVAVEIRQRLIEMPAGPEAVDIRVIPAGLLAPGFLLIIFEAQSTDNLETPLVLPAALEPEAVVQQLEHELTRANSNLRSTVEQYETGVEELKASNEELQAMNEELRSAGEELETSREELQSVNEELTTVNTELRNRLEELGRANSDLRNLMSATAIATVFLGRELEIMRYTPSAVPLFNLIPGDIGRPIADLKTRLDYPGLTADAGKVLHTLVPIERELREDGHWYLARILPYRTLEDHIAGVVLTLVDITECRHAEEALRESEEKFRTLSNSAPALVWVCKASSGENIYFNDRWSEYTGQTRAESAGYGWTAASHPDDWKRIAPLWEQCRTTGDVYAGEIRYRRHDGEYRWFTFRALPTRNNRGEFEAWYGTSVDVHDQKLAEAALAKSEASLAGQKEVFQATVQQSERQNQVRQAFLLKLSDELRPLADAVRIQEAASSLLGEHLQVDRAAFAELSPDGENMATRDGWLAQGVSSIAGVYPAVDFGNFFKDVQTGRTAVVEDALADTTFQSHESTWALPGLRAAVAHPVMKNDRLVAAMYVQSISPRRWTENEISLVTEVGMRTWEAVERARAEESLREREALLAGQKEAFQEAMDGALLAVSLGVLARTAVAQMGPGVQCGFYLANYESGELFHAAGMPEELVKANSDVKIGADAPGCGLAVHSGQSVITEDALASPRWASHRSMPERYGFRGVWSFPISTTAGKVLGTFALYFPNPRVSTPRDHEFAANLGRAAGVIISRSQEAEQRARAEEALRDSEARMRRAISVPKVGVLFFNLGGSIHEANAAFQEMCGYSNDELRSMVHWEELTAPGFHNLTKYSAKNLAERGETPPYEKMMIRKDGTPWWGLFAPTRLSGSGPTAECVEFAFDITQSKQAEEALRASGERLQKALSIETVGVLFFSLDGPILDANPAFTRMVGYSLEELRQMADVKNLTAPEFLAATEKTLDDLRTRGETPPYEKQMLRKDGTRLWGLCAPTRLPGNDECVKFVIDIADRKQAEDAVRATQKQLQSAAQESERARTEAETARAQAEAAGEAKNNFLAVLSHELRTPLTPVAMAAQSLGRRKDLPEPVREALSMIQRNVQLEARLVDDLLDVTRIERGKMELNRSSVEMHQVIRRALETTEADIEAKRQRLAVELNGTHHNLDGDANRLQQVVWNLLRNASKFTPEEGDIRVSTWNEPGKLLIEIRDSGIGIAEDALPRIFEAFNQADISITRRFGGLGLGLAIARAIVAAHEGELRVSSKGTGRGAAFTVVLPVLQSKQ